MPYKIHSFAEKLRNAGDIEKTGIQPNANPGNVVTGVGYGAGAMLIGVFDGVSGIVTQPYKGAKQNGVSGAAKGLGKGIIGLVSKPIAGTVDFVSCTA